MNNKTLKNVLTALILFIAVSVSAQEKTINILAINDMHAYLDRIPQFGAVVDSLKTLYPNMLIVSSGDNRTGNPFNDMYPEPSRPMTELMNEIGFSISILGNHEFDANVSGLKKQVERSKFPYICSNISLPDSMGLKFDPYKIFEVDSVKIGFLGIIQLGARNIPDCHPDKVKNVRFTPVVETIDKYADVVRKQCDIEILLSHIGYEDDIKMAEKFPMFDAILGGHSHTKVENNTVKNGVIITQSVNKVKYCTLVQFTVLDGKVIKKTSKLIDIDHFSKKSEKLENMVAEFSKNPELQKKITTLEKPVKGLDNFGCLMTDGQAFGSNCQIAIQNGGGVRYDYHDAGDFTVKDALMLDPFGNLMVTFKISGKQILDIIKECKQNDEGVEPFVSGMTYKMIVDKNDETKVISVEGFLLNGKKIKPKKIYSLAANSYTVSISSLAKLDGVETTKTSCDCMREYLSTKPSFDYSTTTRTTIIRQ
ncbi:MAG: bifunctional metallophosphatase/5'-nucleotidase [Bacteroidales bacterium]|nr:bifunctional metallophosphatase/5'-nucleotidase [Bacteroidales bacterium]